MQRHALLGDVVAHVFNRYQSVVTLHVFGNQARRLALIKLTRSTFLQACECGGEFGLTPDSTLFVVIAVVVINLAAVFVRLEEAFVAAQAARERVVKRKTICGETTRRLNQLRPSQLS